MVCKPLELIKGLIRQATRDDDTALILDFFAGSGTTGHAVLDLNEEDGTAKRFILVSNRESSQDNPNRNICRDVTAPRIRKAIQGYQYKGAKGKVNEVEALGGGFAYLEMARIPRADVQTELREEQTWIALQMMNNFPISLPQKGIQMAENDQHRIVHLKRNTSSDDILRIRTLLQASSKPTTIYSKQPLIAEELLGIGPLRQFETIPQVILRRFWR